MLLEKVNIRERVYISCRYLIELFKINSHTIFNNSVFIRLLWNFQKQCRYNYVILFKFLYLFINLLFMFKRYRRSLMGCASTVVIISWYTSSVQVSLSGFRSSGWYVYIFWIVIVTRFRELTIASPVSKFITYITRSNWFFRNCSVSFVEFLGFFYRWFIRSSSLVTSMGFSKTSQAVRPYLCTIMYTWPINK